MGYKYPQNWRNILRYTLNVHVGSCHVYSGIINQERREDILNEIVENIGSVLKHSLEQQPIEHRKRVTIQMFEMLDVDDSGIWQGGSSKW